MLLKLYKLIVCNSTYMYTSCKRKKKQWVGATFVASLKSLRFCMPSWMNKATLSNVYNVTEAPGHQVNIPRGWSMCFPLVVDSLSAPQCPVSTCHNDLSQIPPLLHLISFCLAVTVPIKWFILPPKDTHVTCQRRPAWISFSSEQHTNMWCMTLPEWQWCMQMGCVFRVHQTCSVSLPLWAWFELRNCQWIVLPADAPLLSLQFDVVLQICSWMIVWALESVKSTSIEVRQSFYNRCIHTPLFAGMQGGMKKFLDVRSQLFFDVTQSMSVSSSTQD